MRIQSCVSARLSVRLALVLLTGVIVAASVGAGPISKLPLLHQILVLGKESARAPFPVYTDTNKGTTLQQVVESGADINEAAPISGMTPLHIALERKLRIEVIDYLLAHGANVMAKDSYDRTPLHIALFTDNEVAAEQLLAKGAVEDVFAAALSKNSESLDKMLSADPSLAKKSNACGETPLHWAARRGRLANIRVLLDKGADVNARDASGLTACHDVILAGDKKAQYKYNPVSGTVEESNAVAIDDKTEMLKLLIQRGADVNLLSTRSISGRNRSLPACAPLHMAICLNEEDTARTLLAQGADINLRDAKEHAPLYYAAQWSPPVALKLLELGASVNAGGANDNWTVLHYAHSCPELADALLAKGADPNVRSKRKNQTAMDVAIERDCAEALIPIYKKHRVLVSDKIPLNSQKITDAIGDGLPNEKGGRWMNPPDAAVIEHIKPLIKANPQLVNAQDGRGRLPLGTAVSCFRVEITQWLLENGANPNATDKKGQTPLSMARDKAANNTSATKTNAMAAIIKCLLGHGASE